MSQIRSSRGMALVSVLFLLMILSALAAATTTNAQIEMMVVRNTVSSAQAEAAAEAGLNHAVELAIPYAQQFAANGFPDVSAAMTDLLLGPDGRSGNAAADADNGSLEALGIPRPPAQVALAGVFGTGYETRVYDEDDPARGVTLTAADLARIGEDGDPTTDANSTLVVQAIGYAPDGSMTILETTFIGTAGGGGLPAAVVTGGTLIIRGNPTFIGSQGSVHANGDLDIAGNPHIAVNATASGGFTVSGDPTIGGISGGGHATMPIPPVAAIDYKPLADFILTSGGVMTDQLGSTICDASVKKRACKSLGYGWVWDDPGWSIESRTSTDGTYYVEGPATISGNLGKPGRPAALTIIAEDSIKISGNPDLTPDTPELMFVTDGDLMITGQLGIPLTVEGAMLVHEQLHISGRAVLSGQILVEDAEDNSTLVSGDSSISGTPTISYNGTLGGGGTGAGVPVFTLTAWREVR